MQNRKLFISMFGLLFILTTSLGLFFGCQPPVQKSTGNQVNTKIKDEPITIDKQQIRDYVRKLCSRDFQGRRAGTKGEAEAALFISRELKKMGINPAGSRDTYFQSFPLPTMDLHWEGKRLVFFTKEDTSDLVADNILGKIEGPIASDTYIILSAHYDHLGIFANQQYSGANDNASGVAALLEIARVLKEQEEKLPCSVIIAFWSGEEMGLLGSRYFVENPTVQLDKIKLNINMDSIGSGSNNNFIIWKGGPEEVLQKVFASWSNWEDSKKTFQYTTVNSSDHKSLAGANIPSLTILAEDWLEGNHTVRDNYAILNYDKITYLAQHIAEYLTSEDSIFLGKE